MILADITPLQPAEGEAREWAEQELAKGKYSYEETWIQKLIDFLDGLGRWLGKFGTGKAGVQDYTVLVAVLLALAFLIFLIFRFARRGGTPALGHTSREAKPLFDDLRSSQELFAAAESALRAGDWNTAVMERYRGVIRLLDERSYVDVTPGMTAREAAVAGSNAAGYPELFYSVSAWFNGIYYSDIQATEGAVRDSAQLEEICKKLEPRRTRVQNDLVVTP